VARVRLKGINSRRKRLSDGTFKTYWYAWKGGPRIDAEPGSPDFLVRYQEAVANRTERKPGTVFSILQGYQASTAFTGLAARTRRDYVRHIMKIEQEFGDLPLSAMGDRRVRGEFLAWRDMLAAESPRQADYTWSVLARLMSWAHDRGLIVANPCTKAGRVYRGSRVNQVWTDDDEARFMAVADWHLRLALQMALWTGQRQGDLLRLAWTQYDGARIRLQQRKTGARVIIPVAAPLRTLLDRTERRGATILTNLEGKPWTEAGFQSSWRKAQVKAGIEGLTFHDLRGTTVTRLAMMEATEAEIATLTGHTLRDVRAILDSHYLKRDPKLAESAIQKLERRTKKPD
jgi:integrase